MQQTILELRDGWDVYTPCGHGTALVLFSGSYLSNSVLLVKLDNGEIKHFDTNDIRMSGSPTYGEQLVPTMPHDWKK